MLIQIKNKILLLDAVSFAEFLPGNPDELNSRPALNLIVDGQDLKLRDEEAITIWHAIQRNATCLAPVGLNWKVSIAPFRES